MEADSPAESHAGASTGIPPGPSRNTSSSENRLLSWNKSVIARCAQKVTKELSDKPPLTCKVLDLVIHTRTPLPLNSRCCPKLPRKKKHMRLSNSLQLRAQCCRKRERKKLDPAPHITGVPYKSHCLGLRRWRWWDAALVYFSPRLTP